MSKPLKLLIKYPSRGRVDRFFDGMDSIYNNLSDKENTFVLVTADNDDPAMNDHLIWSRILEYGNVSPIYGVSESKIAAVNRDMDIKGASWNDWDIVCVMSDDIRFCVYGFDDIIRTEMIQHFPEGDGYLHFCEKDSQAALNVMTIIDRKYYDRFGFIYHPEYKSLWCDNEQTEIAKMLGRYRYINYEIFHHFNPAYNYPNMPKDEMFIRQQEIGWTIDQETYQRRKARNFDIHLYQNQKDETNI